MRARSWRQPLALFTDVDISFAPDYFARLHQYRDHAAVYGTKLAQAEFAAYYHWFLRGQALLAALGVLAASGSNLLFTGHLQHTDLAAAYASADLFVFPAANETLGNVVLETMSSGLSMVAPRAGGLLDYVVDGETGLLFEPELQASLVTMVRRLVNAPELARKFGARSRARMVHNSWERVHDDLLAQYAALLRQPPSSVRLRLNTGPEYWIGS